MSKKKVVAEEPADEAATELYYEIKPEHGDVYITINASRGSTVKVMSGEPAPPPRPPKG